MPHGPAHVLQAPLFEHPRQHEPRVALAVQPSEIVLRKQPTE